MPTEILQIFENGKSEEGLNKLSLEQGMVTNLIRGDQNAFNELFELYHHSLYSHVIRFVKSPNLAADIVQDSFIKIWEVRSTLKSECCIRAFLFTIAKNHLLNVLKRASLEKAIKREIMAFTLYAHTGNEDEVIYADFNRFADAAIQSLPPQRRLIFVMHKEEGKDFHQIAVILGISKNTVRDHLAKATKFVRSYLRVNAEISSIFALLGLVA